MICILGNDHDNSDDRESNIDFGDEDQFDPEVSAELEDAPSANEETDVPSANQEMDVPPATEGSVDVMERSKLVVDSGRRRYSCL